jgi:hypothetical protein
MLPLPSKPKTHPPHAAYQLPSPSSKWH